MLRIILAGCLLALSGMSIVGQTSPARDPAIKTVELYSPWVAKGDGRMRHDADLHKKSCFDLVLLEVGCRGQHKLSFGNRIGDNWSIFDVPTGQTTQTRMVNIGQYDWNDKFTVAPIEPWSKLQPGETRAIKIELWGTDGKHGQNGDGTYPTAPRREGNGNKPLDQQVSTTIKMSGEVVRSDKYMPLSEVKKGNMYLVRVVDPENDFYVFIRVDDLVRGTKVVLSYWKWEPPRSIY
jgi:hypothetical protein